MKPRKVVEASIIRRLKSLRKYLQDSGYSTAYLQLCIHGAVLSANNEYWDGGVDELRPINVTVFEDVTEHEAS